MKKMNKQSGIYSNDPVRKATLVLWAAFTGMPTDILQNGKDTEGKYNKRK